MNGNGARIRKGEIERCTKACERAHVEEGKWVCPMFVNVDMCVIMSERGVMCRKFKRREE